MANKKFSVRFPDGKLDEYEGDFEVSKEGLLIVTLSATTSSQIVFSPTAWSWIDVKR